MPNTIHLHRVINSPPERVFRAFSQPDALVKWMAPNGFTATVHEMDFRVQGGYKMSFTNFTTEKSHSFGGQYTEIIPNKLLKYSDQFSDPNLPGKMQVTITLAAVSCGTDLKIVQEGVPDVIPLEGCYLGWQQSLNLLTMLVEPNIPD